VSLLSSRSSPAPPADAGACCRLAADCHAKGRPADALAHYRQALRLQPHRAEAHYGAGLILAALGRPDEALACYRQAVALRPAFAEALTNLGVALAQRGDLPAALDHLRQATAAGPGFAPAHHNLGVALLQRGRPEEAAASLRRALDLRPDYAEAHFNLAHALTALDRRDEALAALREAVRCKPDHAEALCNLGLALTETGRLGEAVILLWQAVRLRPKCVEGHSNLGLALADLGRFDEATACYERALDLDPRRASTHANLGNAYKEQGRTDEALACYDLALCFDPQSVSTHWNRSLAWLQAGDFARGWPEYEWRWRRPGAQPRLSTDRPPWDGSPLEGRTILLWCEQGLGDALQFARYAPLVQRRGGRVVLHCPGILRALFGTLPGIDHLAAEGEPLPPFDVHAPLLSLPGLLGTTLATVPADVPYLAADPALIETWGQRLAAVPGFRVGIAWQGNPHHKWDHFRSVPLGAFAPLARVEGISLVSHQKGPGSEQLVAVKGRLPVVDFGDKLGASGPFPDTAALMRGLDLVVTVDTATAHLAGALGVPVWVVLSTIVDWRWLLGRDDSPWYPGMRLFRQRRLGDWGDVFARVAIEAARAVAAGRPR
jgi:tetratricopeptide (TPR) repeat protein